MPDPGQTIPGAYSIPAVDTTVQTFQGTIANSVDVDLYAVTVRKGQVIHFKIEDTWSRERVDQGLRAALRLFKPDGACFFGHPNQTTNGYQGSFRSGYDGVTYIGISSVPNNSYRILAGSTTPTPYKGHNLKGGYTLSVWGEDQSNSYPVTVTVTNRIVDYYEARSFPHDDRNGNGLLELYRVPVYEILVSGERDSIDKTFKHSAPRFMPYWNNPKKPDPRYSKRGWENSGLSAGRKIVVPRYKREYELHNRFSPYFGAIVMEGNFYIHSGPEVLSDVGWGSAGCVEIIGNFDLFKAHIAVLSGIKGMNLEKTIEELVRQKRLIVEVESAVPPNIEQSFTREIPDFRKRSISNASR